MPRSLALLLLAAFSLPLAAQDAPLWLRYPAISPDGQTVAFSYMGDLYRVPVGGGRAIQLTTYDGHDTRPVWSPDGQWLAFASDRYGNFDVFVMPAQGGRATRLTHHSAHDHPSDFSPDGQHILFTSTRTDAVQNAQFPSGSLPELYQISSQGGAPTQVLTTPAEEAQYSPDGTRILFHDRKGYEDPWRKHHTSSVTRDVWQYDRSDGSYTNLTTNDEENRNPVYAPDGRSYYYLSEWGSGTFNVYRQLIGGRAGATPITRFDTHPVRFLTISDNETLCYQYDGEVYTQQPGGEPQKLAVEVYRDAEGRRLETVSIASGATDMAVAPSGKEVAFIVRGEVFVTSVETSTTKRVTNTPEQERSVSFSPDGRALLYASERGGSWNLYQMKLARDDERYFFAATLFNEEPVLVSDAETFQPAFSPDGKEVAYLEDRTTLKVLNLASKQSRTILPGNKAFSYADGDQHYAWSPDGQWFLVTYLQDGYWIGEVGLARADGTGEIVNLTESGFSERRPQWAMGGKLVIWFSSRNGLQGVSTSSGPSQSDVYGLFLTQDAYDRYRLSKEEYELLQEAEKEAKKDEEKKDEDDPKDDDTPTPIEIELDDLEERRVRLTIHSSALSDAVVTPDGGKLVYLARYDRGSDLWVTDLRTRETKVLADLNGGGGDLILSKDGKHVFLRSGGRLAKIAVEGGKRSAISYSSEMQLDASAERAYLFEHVWRQVREKFYDPNLHGVDWDRMKRDYARFLPHINNNHDFADLLGELLGELNASHTGARYRPSPDNPDQTASLGVFFDGSYTGNGLRIAEVIDKGPLDRAETEVKAGTVIEQIDGVAITAQTNPYRLLNRKAGDNVRLHLYDPATEKRWEETVKPISQGAENSLRYDRWVAQRRHLTDSLSGGRIGYVHVRGMNDGSYRATIEEVLGRQATKEALIVDTRFNGGGDLVDNLSDFLSGETYMLFTARDGRQVGLEPHRRWTKPSAVLASEGNYSDAHCFPYAYQTKGIGPIIGTAVPGTCTFVWWERLQDRTLVFGIPNLAVEDTNGQPLENQQLEPDIHVASDPAAFAAGRDPQLERAVQVLLQRLN